MNRLGFVCGFLAAAIWGGLYVASRYVLDVVPPITLVALRYVIALAVLGGAMVISRARPVPKRDWPALALLGFIGFGISIIAQFAGTRLAGAANGALITSITPALVVGFAALLLGEPITGRGLGGLLIGDLFLVVATISWALYSVLAKRSSASYPVLTVTTYAAFFGLLFTAPLVPLEWALVGRPDLAHLSPLIIGAILYIGVISTAGAFYLWNKGMALLDANAAAGLFFAQPLVGASLGWLLLRETLITATFVGGALILIGVLLASLTAPAIVLAPTAATASVQRAPNPVQRD